MNTIFICIILLAIVSICQTISFSDGLSFYVPRRDAIRRYSPDAVQNGVITTPESSNVGSTYDGVVDRINKYLFLLSGSEEAYFITKVQLSTFELVQTRRLFTRPFDSYADQEFIYYLTNENGNPNTTLNRHPIDDISGEPQTLPLIGLVNSVGPRPDPRPGFNSSTDLVAYYTGPSGILQRTSTRAFNVIAPIPIPDNQVILWVQNGIAYDVRNRGNEKVVDSYFFLTSALNSTGNSLVVGIASDTIDAVQEDRYRRGNLHLVASSSSNNHFIYQRIRDNTLERLNRFNIDRAANIIPRVDNNKLHYTSGATLYVYDVENGSKKTANIDQAYSFDENLKPNLKVLNYALTLEHLEASFYRDALNKFTLDDFTANNLTQQDLDYFNDIAEHEAVHVSTLVQVIRSLGGVAVEECQYDFGYGDSFTQFVAVAQALENTGVSAYDGAIAMITVDALKTAAATIATVEARHAAYLNILNKNSPFPSAFDTPLNMTQVLSIAGPFIVSCPSVNDRCNGISSNSTDICSGRGACSLTVCHCDSGFVGRNCENSASASTSCPSASAEPEDRSLFVEGATENYSSASTVTGLISSMVVAVIACITLM